MKSMLNRWQQRLIAGAMLAVAVVSTPVMANIAQVPLYLTNAAAPLMMLTMSKDEQLFKKAYTDYTDLDGDGLLDTTYNDNFVYSGYFDSRLCYGYSNSRFKAQAVAVDLNGNGRAHECGSSVSPNTARWSGNFLNWVTMSRIDVLRFVLYGGNRSTDSATQTILERAHIPNDLHAWVKVYAGSDIANYTPFSGTQSFCNASFGTSSADTPRIRRAPGNWSEWAATSVSQCLWANTSDAPSQPTSNAEFVARVEVCDPAAVSTLRESFCKRYGASYKPVGLLQDYGEPQAGMTEGRMRFGLMSGSFSNPRSGGILRRNIGKISNNANAATPGGCTAGDEINLTDGTFCNTTDGAEGIINTISRLRLTQWSGSNWNDCNTYGIHNRTGGNGQLNNPGPSTANNRRCSAWGNPMSELFAETLRYISGLSATSGFSSGTDLAGLPAPGWLDPYRPTSSGGAPYCATCSILVLSSGLASFDSDEIPANSVLTRDAAAATRALGDLEGITGNRYLAGRMVASQNELQVGAPVNTHEDLCTNQTVTDLGLVRGLCPDIPSQEGSFLMAGLAFQARTQDMWGSAGTRQARPSSHRLNVNTYAVALAENLPKFDIPVGNSRITFAPLCQANNTGSATASSSGWRSCYLGSVTVGPKTSSVYPNHVYGRPLESDGSAGSFSLVWEDSQWGNDHDNDVVTMITYCVGDRCTRSAHSPRAGTGSSDSATYSGYDICWRSNSPVCASGTPVVGPNEVLIRIENVSAYAGNAMLTGYSISGSNDDGVKRVALRPGGSDGSVLTGSANPPTNWARPHVAKYSLGSSDVGQLQNPLWYAAKYGGFVTLDQTAPLTPQAQGQASWDKNNTGTPDAFFKVTDPAKLKQALGDVFSNVLERSSSAAAIATNSTRLDTETLIFQARFNSSDWSGQVVAYQVNSNGTIGNVAWDTNNSGTFPSNSDNRRIFTWNESANSGAGGGVEFLWNQLNAAQQTALGGGNATLGENRLHWLRGRRTLEVGQPGGIFRPRTYLLGDIVNSDPAYVGATNFGYERLPAGTAGQDSYAAYRSTTASRPRMLYVGSNGGMLHALNAETGQEVFAYVPRTIYPNLPSLTSPSYEHRYYVDGAPNVGDAYINGAWRTILVGTTGAGGSGVFALDVTSPNSFNASNVLWERDSSSAGFSNLGNTIGYATIGRLGSGEFAGEWVAIFGNGYGSTNGRASLYIVRVSDGTLLKEIVACNSEINTCPETGNGLSTPALLVDNNRNIVAAYAGDLKGNLWKFDLSSSSYGIAFSQGSNPRPLFRARTGDATPLNQPITAPVEIGIHPSGGYMIYFGTGKYYETGDNLVGTNPLKHTFYGIWDQVGYSNNPTRVSNGRSDLQQQTIIGEGTRTVTDVSTGASQTFGVRAVSANTINWTGNSAKRGWYLDLVSPVTGAAGERVVSAPRLRNGRVIFPTLIPSADACAAGGTSWLMEIDAVTGGRLNSAVFDLNNDRLFNSDDYMLVNGQWIPVSGLGSNEGIIKTPAITSAGEVEYKYAGGSAGGIVTIIERGAARDGRQSWRQMR